MSLEFYENLLPQAQFLAEKLNNKKLMLATAESCTGGLLASLFTEIPGSSSWFKGGVVSYANELKEALLKVDPKTIAEYGAVSSETAEAMARGGLKEMEVDLCISITGIAGPGGATPGKGVGTVWIGYARKGDSLWVKSKLFNFSGNRSEVRWQAVKEALHILNAEV